MHPRARGHSSRWTACDLRLTSNGCGWWMYIHDIETKVCERKHLEVRCSHSEIAVNVYDIGLTRY